MIIKASVYSRYVEVKSTMFDAIHIPENRDITIKENIINAFKVYCKKHNITGEYYYYYDDPGGFWYFHPLAIGKVLV